MIKNNLVLNFNKFVLFSMNQEALEIMENPKENSINPKENSINLAKQIFGILYDISINSKSVTNVTYIVNYLPEILKKIFKKIIIKVEQNKYVLLK